MSGSLFLPGLAPLSSRRAFRDSLSLITGSSHGAGITIDVLDAEPPRAGVWRAASLVVVDDQTLANREQRFGVVSSETA